MQDVLAAGFVPEKADPKAKSKALHGRVQKGAGGTFTDQLPPVARQLDREMSELFLFLATCSQSFVRQAVLVVGTQCLVQIGLL